MTRGPNVIQSEESDAVSIFIMTFTDAVLVAVLDYAFCVLRCYRHANRAWIGKNCFLSD